MDEDLQNLDQLLIEQALLRCHVKTLEAGFFEVCEHLLNKDESTNLKSNYYHTLRNEANRLTSLNEVLHEPQALSRALFELHSFVESQLRDLES